MAAELDFKLVRCNRESAQIEDFVVKHAQGEAVRFYVRPAGLEPHDVSRF
ncbi:MAG: hypothetical protein WD382_06700 [Halofilum sp. (in: g-proteobacteria)]